METQKRWQLCLIIAVILLTIYNILPTVFFYAQPLKKPIEQKEASGISQEIMARVNTLEEEATAWIASFNKNLGITAKNIQLEEKNPQFIRVTYASAREADLVNRILPRAGQLISFVPAQLTPTVSAESNEVLVQRRVGTHFDETHPEHFFTFTTKIEDNGTIAPLYKDLIYDRVAALAVAAGQESVNARILENNPSDEALVELSKNIVLHEKTFGKNSPLLKRYYNSFTLSNAADKAKSIDTFVSSLDALSKKLSADAEAIAAQQKELQAKQGFADATKEEAQKLLESQAKTVTLAHSIVQRNLDAFKGGAEPLTHEGVLHTLQQEVASTAKEETLSLGNRNPFISHLLVDWRNDRVALVLHPELAQSRAHESISEASNYFADQANQLLVNEIATLTRQTGETISPYNDNYLVHLNDLTNSKSVLVLSLGALAESQSYRFKEKIASLWTREHSDFSEENYPLNDFASYQKLSEEAKKLGLVVYAPSASKEAPPAGFKTGSIYVIAKGVQPMLQQFGESPEAPQSKLFLKDFQELQGLLQQEGFYGYPAMAYGFGPEYKQDYIFELDDYYSTLVKATREQFSVRGSKRQAVLEFTDVEQRLLTLNRIEDSIHEDLLKWKDAYHAAQVDLNLKARYDVPPPTRSAYWDNLTLSTVKYFRGDDRKILKWGLDLSGGKTVRIGLRDQSGRAITNPDDLNEGVNELYKRVNKMGVSEVGIRVEGKNIILDFPGSQGLSAAELVKASSMTFHVVNEQFSLNPRQRPVVAPVNQFLQEVWNEAVVTGKKSIEEINQIAWQHMGGSEGIPQSEAAKTLYDQGLRLAAPQSVTPSSAFNDSLSSIAMLRGDDFTAWEGQSHPLITVFNNYALEGSRLENVHAGYDPSKGNLLSFSVAGSGVNSAGQKSNARDDFYAWTSQFAQEKIVGTTKETLSNGAGWRMAVILNGTVVSSPTLNSPLRDHAMITGHFSQREVNQLASDLKAGSLSFTPKILSEQNVSPELGKEERTNGIVAALVATLLVIVVMIAYYRFAGVVASVAVIFLLLVIWGVLQNLDAALTLPSIAGIILTLGMAVDANVLVYERIREEFAISKRLPSAVQAGYRKAFSAIIDSNLTTIIAAVILMQFDSGPIKGFALTLIVGIITSMFTSLFMTRYFFAGWVQNPQHKQLSMASFITKTNFNFLSKAKMAVIGSVIVIVIGGYFLVSQRNTMLGMDFTGGFALTLDLPQQADENYREAVSKALVKGGATSEEFQIRELNTPHNLRLQLGMMMEEPGHPFHGMPLETDAPDVVYAYQYNPRITWVIQSLENAGIILDAKELASLEQNWSEMSGQLSDTMRNNALIALAAALLCILIYITIRFEFKYALSAIIGLAHDILITLAILGVLHLIGVPIQIDLQVIAALMTIVGYSLNDTIIIFDRIREDVRIMRKSPFPVIVNHALNATLSRTMMTSGTTLVVLLALLILGGSTIFNFALVMTIGVVIGTLSSLFVAAPLMLFFHNKEERKNVTGTSRTIAKISAS